MHGVTSSQNFVEEWKSVIDFTKTVLSISTGLLAAIASLLLIGNYRLQGYGWVPPVLLIISALLSLFGFGRAIQALRAGSAKNAALWLSNISVFVLIGAIISAPFAIQTEASSIDQSPELNRGSNKKVAGGLERKKLLRDFPQRRRTHTDLSSERSYGPSAVFDGDEKHSSD